MPPHGTEYDNNTNDNNKNSKIAFLSKADRPHMCVFSYDLDPMTLVLDIDLDVLKMCLHTKKKIV